MEDVEHYKAWTEFKSWSGKGMKDAKYSVSWELNSIAGLTLYEEAIKGV